MPQAASDKYAESGMQDSLLPSETRTLLVSRRTGFSEGKSRSHPYVRLRKRRGRRVHKVLYEKKRGRVVGHPQRKTKSVRKCRQGDRGRCLFLPKPTAVLLIASLKFLPVSTSVFL